MSLVVRFWERLAVRSCSSPANLRRQVAEAAMSLRVSVVTPLRVKPSGRAAGRLAGEASPVSCCFRSMPVPRSSALSRVLAVEVVVDGGAADRAPGPGRRCRRPGGSSAAGRWRVLGDALVGLARGLQVVGVGQVAGERQRLGDREGREADGLAVVEAEVGADRAGAGRWPARFLGIRLMIPAEPSGR